MVRRVLAVLAFAVVPFIAIPTALAPGASAAPSAPVQACMNDGWQTLTNVSGQPFTNQGLCIAYQILHPVSLNDLANSSFSGTTSFAVHEGLCQGPPPDFVFVIFDAAYPGSASVGNVNVQIAGCMAFFTTYAGTFTITTNVGTLSGTASGPVTLTVGPGFSFSFLFQITLSVQTGTGSFAGTTGDILQFSTQYPGSLYAVTP